MGKIRRLKIYTNKLNKNKKILVYSDLHLGYKKSRGFEKILQIKELKPTNFDYILIPGDIVHSGKSLENPLIKKQVVSFLRNLTGDTKTYVSIGNHDQYERLEFEYWQPYSKEPIIDTLNSIPNIHVLTNKELFSEDSVEFRALNNSTEYYLEANESEEYYKKEYLSISNQPNFSKNSFSILLTHDPKSIYRLSKEEKKCLVPNTDLVISGHMHNGFTPNFLQVFLGGYGLISPDYTIFPEIAYGVKQIGETIFLTNGAISTFVESSIINNLYGINCTIIEIIPKPKAKTLTLTYK